MSASLHFRRHTSDKSSFSRPTLSMFWERKTACSPYTVRATRVLLCQVRSVSNFRGTDCRVLRTSSSDSSTQKGITHALHPPRRKNPILSTMHRSYECHDGLPVNKARSQVVLTCSALRLVDRKGHIPSPYSGLQKRVFLLG